MGLMVNNIQTEKMLFQCRDTTRILQHHVCDGRKDCPDGWDEDICTCSGYDSNSMRHAALCKYSRLFFKCFTVENYKLNYKICDCYED